ncbi:MAG: hypothetical protein R3E01_00245 [Pirellulaceae bacterium]
MKEKLIFYNIGCGVVSGLRPLATEFHAKLALPCCGELVNND